MTTGTDSAIAMAEGSVPLLGHTHLLLRDPLGYLRAQLAADPVTRLRLVNQDCYLINRTDLAMRVLATQQQEFDKGGPFMEASRLLVGNGVITCTAEDHRSQLPLVQPAFRREQITQYAYVMQQCVQEVTDSWTDGATVAIDKEMYRLSALVIARTLVASPAGHQAAATMAEVLPVLLQGMFRRMLVPLPRLHRLPIPANRRFDDAMARLDAAIADITADYRRLDADQGDVLSRIIYRPDGSGRRLTDGQVRDQIMSLLAAGIETTATLLTWTCHTLARNDHAAQELQDEVDQTLRGRIPALEDLPKLPYTKLVLTEALRLYPPTWILTRQAVRQTRLERFPLSEGAIVILSPFALQRDPKVFPDPDAFIPQRWLPGSVTPQQRRSLLAFGGGRRRCLGESFGMTQAAISLATIVSRWDLRATSQDAVKMVPRLLLVPRPQLMTAHRRR